MPFIDSHCHLDFAPFSENVTHYLQAATEQQVIEFVVPSISAANLAKVLNLSSQYANIHHAFGYHPCFMAQHKPEHIDLLRSYVASHKPCAIGEIGLDFFIEKDPQARAAQMQLFKRQLQLAVEVNLPVILHVRKAHDDVLNLLKKMKFKAAGIVHAFNGSPAQAQRYTQEFGFKLGFGGAITHARATKLRGLVKSLALTDIVLETDAPDMPLANMQGAYNQPANISVIAQVVFELRQEGRIEIERQLEHNARACLNLKPNYVSE